MRERRIEELEAVGSWWWVNRVSGMNSEGWLGLWVCIGERDKERRN